MLRDVARLAHVIVLPWSPCILTNARQVWQVRGDGLRVGAAIDGLVVKLDAAADNQQQPRRVSGLLFPATVAPLQNCEPRLVS